MDDRMILYHFTGEPMMFDATRTYDQSTVQRGYGKPVGLWLSDETEDDGWKSWCIDSDWGLGNLAHVTAFALQPDANVLRIHTEDQLRAFHWGYGVEQYPGRDYSIIGIDWPRVASEWDGIVITPHQWHARSDFAMMWYSGWDCASGCIWNLRAIELVRSDEEIARLTHG